MPTHNIITIGASAGGLRPLMEILSGLPAELPASLFVTLHLAPRSTSRLAELLGRATPLRVKWAEDQEPIESSVVYVAPPDRHLLVNPRQVRVLAGARESGARPSIDVLFRSAAVAYRSRVVGVILSGTLYDGARGMRAVQRCGGTAVVQDPAAAEEAEMPRNALQEVEAAHCLRPVEIAPLLCKLAVQPAAGNGRISEEIAVEDRVAQNAMMGNVSDEAGEDAGVSCPDCGGQLHRLDDGSEVQYRCRVGHAYGPELLLNRQTEQLEQALWIALRVIADRQRVLERLADDYGSRQRPQMAASMGDRAGELAGQAAVLRRALADLTKGEFQPKESGGEEAGNGRK